jgi:hypothetical protein
MQPSIASSCPDSSWCIISSIRITCSSTWRKPSGSWNFALRQVLSSSRASCCCSSCAAVGDTSAGDFDRNSFDELEFFSQKFFLSFLQFMMMSSHMIPPRLEEHFLLLSRSDVSILQRHDAEVHWLAKKSLSSLPACLPACLPAWKRDSQQRRI